MRRFRDHRKLTMVGFRLDKGYCSFGCHGICSEVPGRVSGELGPKTFGAIPSHWEQRYSVAVGVTEKDSDTGVSRVGSGDWQVSEPKGWLAFIKEQRSLALRSSGEHSLSGISGTRGVLGQQRRVKDSRGTSREEVSRVSEVLKVMDHE